MAEGRIASAPVQAATRKSLAERLQVITPGGAQTRSKRATEFPANFPTMLNGGLGAHVWDDKGMYVDWICGLGAVSLGYQYKPVEDAVIKAIHEGGPSYSLPHRLELETSELLIDTLRSHGLPGVDQVRWVKTGSEGTLAAMMIAREATGRDTILSIGYHGWHAEHQERAGRDEDLLKEITWGNLDWLQDHFEYRGDKTAAVLLEPCRDEEPPYRYLRTIKELCSYYGTPLIFDECVTGFRWAIGGASEYFGVEPDLAVFGKGMANGYPLSCVVGSRDLMSHASDISGTFGGESVSLAACQATIQTYRERDVIGHFAAVGREWLSSDHARGYAYHPVLRGTPEVVMAKVQALAAGGVLVHPKGFNISYSHTKEDAQRAVQILNGIYELCSLCRVGTPHHTVGTGSIGSASRYVAWDLHEVSDSSGVGLAECPAAHRYDLRLTR